MYSSFYSYAMSICSRYASNHDDAIEILNDGFLKIFKEIHHFKPSYDDNSASFKGWLRKIMVYTAIDHFRKNKKHLLNGHMDPANLQIETHEEDALDKMTHEEILNTVKQLSPAYRTVFNLFVIDGLSHEEIATKLNISTGTSKSNLAKARMHLQKILAKTHKIHFTRNVV